jgi:hypothetical protein
MQGEGEKGHLHHAPHERLRFELIVAPLGELARLLLGQLQGLGFRFQGVGFRVWGLGFRLRGAQLGELARLFLGRLQVTVRASQARFEAK